MIGVNAFFDEIDKIAASKWRRMLRMGQVGADDVARLRAAQRPGGGALLDTGREIAGIERGTGSIANKLGVDIKDISAGAAVKDLKSGVQKALKGEEKPFTELGQQALGTVLARQGGGAMAVPRMRRVYMQRGSGVIGKGLKGQDADAMRAVVRRHEIDEMRAAKRMGDKALRTGKEQPKQFLVSRSPEGLSERFQALSNDTNSRALEALSGLTRESNPEFASQLMLARGKMPARGKLMAGLHMSPEPVLREGTHLPMLPSRVTNRLQRFRRGETEMLGGLGYRHGQDIAPAQRRAIMKKFERGGF